ncbi:MAG TPA: DUF5752 family protein [bacterium]|nr:DUF5752 family protein [bacterium]
MGKRAANAAFRFTSCHGLQQMLGRVARDELELLQHLDEVPIESIHHHTHAYFLRHHYLAGAYPNDFATWAAIQVRDRVLGERLAIVDPFDFQDLEALRSTLITIVDDHLTHTPVVPRVVYGEPFYFMITTLAEFPTGLEARTLREFRDGLARAEVSVVYFHLFEAPRRRLPTFGAWLEMQGEAGLAEEVRRLHPYTSDLEGLRARLLTLCDAALAGRLEVKGPHGD